MSVEESKFHTKSRFIDFNFTAKLMNVNLNDEILAIRQNVKLQHFTVDKNSVDLSQHTLSYATKSQKEKVKKIPRNHHNKVRESKWELLSSEKKKISFNFEFLFIRTSYTVLIVSHSRLHCSRRVPDKSVVDDSLISISPSSHKNCYESMTRE